MQAAAEQVLELLAFVLKIKSKEKRNSLYMYKT